MVWPGEDFYGELNRFVKEKNIRAGSVFLFGALKETHMITGFRSGEGYDYVRGPLRACVKKS